MLTCVCCQYCKNEPLFAKLLNFFGNKILHKIFNNVMDKKVCKPLCLKIVVGTNILRRKGIMNTLTEYMV